jgi:hypothetical protein
MAGPPSNRQAHKWCIETLNSQAPAKDQLVIVPRDLGTMWQYCFKYLPVVHCQFVVFYHLCKAQMIQKKLHPTKNLRVKQKAPSLDISAPHKPKKGESTGPLAAVLRNLHKVAAYHCQSIIFTTVNKCLEKVKHTAIEEAFNGDVGKNILGACHQLINRDGPFFHLYNTHESDDRIKLVLKCSCCGNDTSSNYVAGQDITVQLLQTFVNGKNFQGCAIWKMADSVMMSMKKALSLVPILSPTIVRFNLTCRMVSYASGKNESTFMQLIDHSMYAMEKQDKMGISADDDEQL